MTETVIPLNKAKLVLVVVGALAFVATGVFMWASADDPANRFDPFATRCIAAASIAFFGACGVYGCFKMFDSKPGLVIDTEGLVDNSSGAAVGRIPWADIVGVSVFTMQRQRMLTIELRDVQKYVERGGRLRRLLNRANTKLTGSPINIASTTLSIGFDELERTIREALRTQNPRS